MLYDIAITSVSLTDYTGTVEVYLNGNVLTGNITVSGTTNESQIQGTFAGGGTGFAVGSFDILFDTPNNRGATLARIETSGLQWTGNVYGYVTETGGLATNLTGLYSGTDDEVPSCIYTGDFVIPDSNLNVYMMDHDVLDNGGCNFITEAHTGFASVIDNIGTDDKLVYVFANGLISLFAIMER